MKSKSKKVKLNEGYNGLAKFLAYNCYRNTFIEKLHEGFYPITKTGDYSDVKVIDGTGEEIPWNSLSRISDKEMCRLNKEIVNKIYTFFMLKDDEAAQEFFSSRYPSEWDDAKLDDNFLEALELFKQRTRKVTSKLSGEK